ncbi:hypothetical protein BDV96DRAFT_249629 [Lophiotrema nucula]|uniref:Mitochondrial pyruvate carrier n=1 Tax=Lophiotrema nucula TaxID=690887 RepID=A0A6A5YPR7_9PLEO|nr:hypothetical protein BDV96DRAFT_249629 [Lophiotrema nucula]
MAAAVKALNAKIRSNKYLDYFCSTHFWGPASNFGIPLAAVADMSKDPEIISGRMTLSLSLYSAVFMRYSLAVTPKNYLLFGCHFINCSSQIVQGYRFLNYWNFGGRELAEKGKEAAKAVELKGKEAASAVQEKAQQVVGK